MRSRKTLFLVVFGAFVLILALGFFWLRSADYHIRGWLFASRLAMGNDLSWWERMYGASKSDSPQYWWDRAHRHESALLGMGYLTKSQFRLTNRVMTREFSSNFFYRINQRFGTNGDQVWLCMMLTNRMGIDLTVPVKDYAIWEQTFRECATLYASNLPPSAVSAAAEK